ncbi:unnamed protein product [Ectocarpus sp. CCAP 1310/34]|nr:unnamed protein product [Ectocarpus sp. CCAP 1310/34]
MRALTLRQELEEAVPGAFNLSASSLEEVVRAWIEFEPEWAEEAKRRYLNKGTYSTSQAAKKIRRAKGAEMKARVLAAAADEFRAESIELLDGVVSDVAKTISAAAEMNDVRADTSTEDSCLSNFQLAHTVQVAMTLIQLYTQQADGFDRKDALAIAAEVGRRTVQTVQQWERDFIAHGRIKKPDTGRFKRRFLLELDEGVFKLAKGWVLENCGILSGQANKTAEDFRKWVNSTIMPMLEEQEKDGINAFHGLRVKLVEVKENEPPKRQISLSTATEWLKKMGCEYHDGKKGLYFDGHDDKKTLEYRHDEFLPALFDTRDYMEVWIPMGKDEAIVWGVDVETVEETERLPDGGVWVCVDDLESALADLPEDLQARVQSKKTYPDGRRAMLLYQDESIFRANDDQRRAWYRDGQHVPVKKSQGQGIMVSGTIIHNVGFFSASRAQIQDAERNRRKRCAASAAAKRRGENVKVEKFRPIDMLHEDEHGQYWSYHLFEYGKNMEGYWTGLRMLDHMSDVLDMFTVLYPEHKPVGLFDWSSCHDCMEVGAPSVKRMNLGVGGVRNGEELAPMDPVTILEDTPNLSAGTVQHVVFRRGDDRPFHSPHLKPAQYVGKLKGMRQILWERGLLVKGMSKTGGSGLVLLMQRHGGAFSFFLSTTASAVSVVQGYCKKAYTHALMYRETCVQGPESKKAYKKYKSHRRPTPKEWRP